MVYYKDKFKDGRTITLDDRADLDLKPNPFNFMRCKFYDRYTSDKISDEEFKDGCICKCYTVVSKRLDYNEKPNSFRVRIVESFTSVYLENNYKTFLKNPKYNMPSDFFSLLSVSFGEQAKDLLAEDAYYISRIIKDQVYRCWLQDQINNGNIVVDDDDLPY